MVMPESTSAPDDDEDSEDYATLTCVRRHNVPLAGDNCDKPVALHILALCQLCQLIPMLIEVSLASAL